MPQTCVPCVLCCNLALAIWDYFAGVRYLLMTFNSFCSSHIYNRIQHMMCNSGYKVLYDVFGTYWILCSRGVCRKFSLKQFGVGLRSTTVVVSATSLVRYSLDLMHCASADWRLCFCFIVFTYWGSCPGFFVALLFYLHWVFDLIMLLCFDDFCNVLCCIENSTYNEYWWAYETILNCNDRLLVEHWDS